MKVRQGPARAVLVSSLVSVLASAVVAGAVASSAAAATTTPPYEPDAGAAGTITFYDASGAVVTSGSASALVGYAVGSAALTSTGSKASLYGYLPKSGQAPGQFSGELLSGPTTYPIAGAPAPVSGSTNPAVKPLAGDLTFADLAKDFPNTATDAYKGLYQIRIKTTDTKYLVADIQISAGTWNEVYPTAGGTPPPTSAVPSIVTANGGPLAGQKTNLTVTGTPGDAYQVFAANRPSSTFNLAHQGTLDANGQAVFEVHPVNNVNFYATTAGGQSPQVIMSVHTALNIAVKYAGHVATFYGQIYPNNRSQAIYIKMVDGSANGAIVGQATRDASGKNWTFKKDFSAQAGRTLKFFSATASDTQNANGHSVNLKTTIR